MSAPTDQAAELVTRQRLADLDQLRERLPLTDPDRHDLDTVDATCGRMRIEKSNAERIATQRRTALLRAIRADDGRWKSGRVVRLYEHLGYGHLSQSTAARDLLTLAAAGHLVRHETNGVRYFTRRETA